MILWRQVMQRLWRKNSDLMAQLTDAQYRLWLDVVCNEPWRRASNRSQTVMLTRWRRWSGCDG